MKISYSFIAGIRESMGTNGINVMVADERQSITVQEAVNYLEAAPDIAAMNIAAIDVTAKNILIFIRLSTGGLKRVFDLSEPFNPHAQEIVISSMMSGG